MRIIVCIKQVPNSALIQVDPQKGTLIRDGVPSIINPDDKNAIEEALRIREKFPGTSIQVICMGPAQAENALRETLALGADQGILLSDRAFAGSDTRATSLVLAAAIRKIGDFDIIICGRQAIDGDTAQVGPQLAEDLGIPQITYVSHLEIDGDQVTAHRNLEDSYFVMHAKLPLLLTALRELNQVRLPSIQGIRQAFYKPILHWGEKDLALDTSKIGLDGSPTKVLRSFVPKPRSLGEMLEGNTQEVVHTLFEKLQATHAI